MISVHALMNRENFILYQLRAGKPDPTLECKVEYLENDTRARVKQQPHKQSTCWYYALNMIRERIGKHPSDEVLSKRKIEKLCSERRKQITLCEASLPAIFNYLSSMKDAFSSFNHIKAKELLEEQDILARFFETEEMLENKPSPRFIFQNFYSQTIYKNLYDYMWYVRSDKRSVINAEFFKDTGYQPASLYKEAQLNDPVNYRANLGSRNWEELETIEQNGLIDRYIMHISAELYELKKSSWSPFQSAAELMKEIKEKGPLVVGGIFGESNYSKAPHEMKKIAGQSIFVWNKGERKEGAVCAHAITIVGIEIKKENALVYYVNPANASDPLDRQAQKLYAISYRSFKENIINLRVAWLDDKVESPAGYAWAAKQFKVVD